MAAILTNNLNSPISHSDKGQQAINKSRLDIMIRGNSVSKIVNQVKGSYSVIPIGLQERNTPSLQLSNISEKDNKGPVRQTNTTDWVSKNENIDDPLYFHDTDKFVLTSIINNIDINRRAQKNKTTYSYDDCLIDPENEVLDLTTKKRTKTKKGHFKNYKKTI